MYWVSCDAIDGTIGREQQLVLILNWFSDIKEPKFEYDFQEPFQCEEEYFPLRKAFNLYLDRYRDQKLVGIRHSISSVRHILQSTVSVLLSKWTYDFTGGKRVHGTQTDENAPVQRTRISFAVSKRSTHDPNCPLRYRSAAKSHPYGSHPQAVMAGDRN